MPPTTAAPTLDPSWKRSVRALTLALNTMQEARKMAAEVDYHGVCILKVWLQTPRYDNAGLK